MIYLYHGTDLEFDTPIPERGRKGTDFGQGFYMTPHLESAVNMAHRVARRKNSLESVVMCYSLDENQLVSAGLRIRSFLNIEPGWLRFVVANRYFQEDAPDHNLDKFQAIDYITDFYVENSQQPMSLMLQDMAECCRSRGGTLV